MKGSPAQWRFAAFQASLLLINLLFTVINPSTINLFSTIWIFHVFWLCVLDGPKDFPAVRTQHPLTSWCSRSWPIFYQQLLSFKGPFQCDLFYDSFCDSWKLQKLEPGRPCQSWAFSASRNSCATQCSGLQSHCRNFCDQYIKSTFMIHYTVETLPFT